MGALLRVYETSIGCLGTLPSLPARPAQAAMLEGATGTVRALTFAAAGQRTFVAQPNFSISQIMRADESSWPRRTPWRAEVG